MMGSRSLDASMLMTLILLMYLVASLVNGRLAPPTCPAICHCDKELWYIHCEGRRLQTVPQDLPETALELYLSSNLLVSIIDNSFLSLTNLTKLSLKNNNIVQISTKAFAGLVNMKILYLTQNQLTGLDGNIFKGLDNLQYVYLSQNLIAVIPNLGTIQSLRRVNLDNNRLEKATFPADFSDLKLLTSIVLANNPNITAIYKKDLQSLPSLSITKIDLTRCGINHIENGTFSSFTRLQSVGLGHIQLKGEPLKYVIDGFGGSHITDLDLSGVISDGTLSVDAFQGLEGVPLRSLKLAHSKITVIQNGTFHYLHTLQHLDLTYCKVEMIQDGALNGMDKLQTLKLKHNDLKALPFGNLPNIWFIDMSHNPNIEEVPDKAFIFMRRLNVLKMRLCGILKMGKGPFIGAEQLEELDLSENIISGLTISIEVFENLGNLKKLNLASNKMGNIGSEAALFKGLISLEELYMGDNKCKNLSKTIFQPLKNLKILDLHGNELGDIINSDEDGELFYGLSALEELNLSFQQKLISLPGKLFQSASNLTKLHLEENAISSWGMGLFSSTPALRFVNLSTNHISLINKSSGFDQLPNGTHVNLYRNPFTCYCDLIWFRNWLNTTSLIFDNIYNYECNAPNDMAHKPLLSFNPTTIEAKCSPLPWLIILLGSIGGLLLVVMVTVSLIYRYRWPLRLHWYYVRHRFHKNEQEDDQEHILEDEIEYDAFISASDNRDEQDWVRNELLPRIDNGHGFSDDEDDDDDLEFQGRHKLCYEPVHLTNMGRSIYRVVAEAIDVSDKVIVVLSNDYLQSGQKREFELQLALRKAMKQGHHTLILVLFHHDVVFNIPADLHLKMERHEELEWTPNDQAGQEVFWQRLQQQLDIKKNKEQVAGHI